MATSEDSHPNAIKVSEDEITCRVCCKSFSSPKLVHCLHTYCHHCITDNLIKEDSCYVFKCPQCMYDTQLNDESGDTLVADLYVIGLQEIVNCHTAKASSCVVCSLKGVTSDATHYCLHCDDSLCENCSKGHNSSSLTASHRVVCLDDLRRGNYDQDILRKRNFVCKKHDREVCRIFCHTCSEPTCVECVLSLHKGHNYEGIENAAEKKRVTLSESLKATSVISSGTSVTLQSAKAELDQLDKEESIFVKNVTETAISFIEKIKQQSQTVLEKGRQGFAEERKRRENTKTIAEAEYPRRENILKVCQRVLESRGIDLVVMGTAVHSGLLLLSNMETVKRHPLMTFKATFNIPKEKDFISFHALSLTDPKQPTEHSLNTRVKNTDSLSSQYNDQSENRVISKKKRGKRRKSKLKDSHDHSGSDEHQETELKDIGKPLTIFRFMFQRCFTAKIGTDKLEPDISSLALRTSETCLILDRGNAKLKVFRNSGDMVYLVELSGKCNLFEQCVHIATGDKVCAVFEGNLLLLTRHLKIECQVTLLPKTNTRKVPIVATFGENILVGNLPGNEMRVFDTSGVVLRTWKSKVGQIHSMKYAGDDKVVSTTWNEMGSVHVESEKSGCLLKIIGDKRKSLTWQPSAAVVDSKGHVIVTDSRRNEISIFSSSGNLLQLFDTMENNVAQPNCMFVDEDDNVYVSCRGGMVAVYDMTND